MFVRVVCVLVFLLLSFHFVKNNFLVAVIAHDDSHMLLLEFLDWLPRRQVYHNFHRPLACLAYFKLVMMTLTV